LSVNEDTALRYFVKSIISVSPALESYKIIKAMERRQLSQNKSAKADIIRNLPFIEQRKQSLSFEDQQRYLLKNKILPSDGVTSEPPP
jgi:hypothetical protein